MSRLDLFYNPAAGSFRQDRLDALVAALGEEGFAVTARKTQPEATSVETDADLVCVFGGDGALRDTVQALGEAAGRVPICIVPSGTINLVARELGYAKKPAAFARQVAEAWRRGPESWVASPLYRLGEAPMVSCLSIGPDSHAVARVSGALKARIGRYAYVVAMLRQMREWPRNTMIVKGERADGSRFELEAEAVIASRGALYAGPFRLAPRAALEAEHFELILLKNSTRVGTLAFSLAAMLGLSLEKYGLSEIHTVRRVEFDRCVTPVQLDGDHMPDCAYAIGPSGLTLRYVV